MATAVVVLAVLGTLAGCGGGDGKSSAVGTEAKPPAPPPPTSTPSRIAFDKVVSKKSQVFWMYTNGTGATQVTKGTQGTNYGACWSPDGNYLCVTSDRGGVGYALWRLNRDGTGGVQLTFPASAYDKHEWASWSPDGTKIAFTSIVGPLATRRIFVVDVATKDVVQLTDDADGTMEDYSPTFSPDSQTVMFQAWTYYDDGTHGLFVVPAAGGTPTAITPPGVQAIHPDWCPLRDGYGLSTVVYSNWHDILMVKVNDQGIPQGAATVVATVNAGDEAQPTISPDGMWVTCRRSPNLIRLKLSSTTPEELNLGTGNLPDWSPAVFPVP